MSKQQRSGINQSTVEFKLAVVGCGRWGKNHVKTAVRLFGNDLIYVCDVDNRRTEETRGLAGEFRFVNDVERIFSDPAVNAVIIATPAETHYELARRALMNNKHVLVEKPMALHAAEARELAKLAAERKLILLVGHLLLFHPALKKIKELIDDGELGKLQYIYSNRLNLGTVRTEENILWSFAPHDISVLQYFIGESPLEVSASGGIFLQPGVHDVTMTTLRYPDNIQAHIHVSWLHPFKEHRLVVIGDKSMVVFEDTRSEDKLILYPKGIDWVDGRPVKRDAPYVPIDFDAAMPLDLEQLHFRDCIVNGASPITGSDNGVAVLEILEQAQQSLEQNEIRVQAQAKPKSPPPAEQGYFVHPTAIVDKGCDIGAGTKIWHYSHIQGGTKIGKKCSLGQNVNTGNNVIIGDHCKIQNNVSIYEGVELEDYVFCGPSMVFTNVLNPRCEFPQRGSDFYQRTRVKKGASIGANATIVCGSTLGRYSFIGAGAVVTKDVPDYALIIGNPGRIAGWMCRCGTRLKFEKDTSSCSNCGREYVNKDNRITCTK